MTQVSAENVRAILDKLHRGVDIVTSVAVPEPFAGAIRQLATAQENLTVLISQKLEAGDISGAQEALLTFWQQLSHVVKILRPEALAGRFAGAVLDQTQQIIDDVKDELNSLWWWGVGLGAGVIGLSALFAYYLHSQGQLMPLIKGGATLAVKAAKTAAMAELGYGPRECRFGVSKGAQKFSYDLFPVTDDGWTKALSQAMNNQGSIFLTCPEGAIRMVKCKKNACSPAMGNR